MFKVSIKYFICFLPLFGALVVLACTRLVMTATQVDSISLAIPTDLIAISQDNLRTTPALAKILFAKQAWGFCATLLIVTCIGTVLIAWSAIGGSLPRSPAKRRRIDVFVMLVLLASIFISLCMGGCQKDVGPKFTQELLALIDTKGITTTVYWLNGAAFLAAMFVVVAMGYVMLPTDAARDLPPIAAQVRRLDRMLYVAAALLVFGTLEIFALFHLAGCTVEATGYAHGKLIARVARETPLMFGAVYSLVLVAMYLPAKLRLSWMAEQTVEELDIVERQRELKRYGLDASFQRRLSRVVAILGPILTAGPVVSIIEHFLKN